METMELFNYYSLDECTDRKRVISTLKKLEKEGKIEYELEKSTDIFEIEDLDLEDSDIEELLEMFDSLDVFPYLDKDDGDDDDYGDDDDDYDNDY
jgi:hypothetical protein